MKVTAKETLKKKSLEDLKKLLKDKQEKMFNLKFKHNATPIGNPLEIKALRREIALLNTLISQKQGEGK
ncbi:MAG: 50S ribosomal protein L29 [Elusimicrobiaceae bacterium]|jgi:large subunit ribosomal protein L29|nr:50S ribosomal protein L29 [Elusimicrobiaceae bacterium]MBT3955237.1 50S ribosomal protein L29 [Elusimicrobiaceae bacterium]MBT4007715.1 50S ribosomal protein L29 [Elusimicrobiaceae bacterium]MBT4402397.1 50S ribosomal protein L29 [Elusimicrobiaceae bacterium]MBT4440392.1 50S ribosomal protein L29 [Elusimicrobiaceae bacterium]